ncbi:MAG: GTP-binding protein [Clostridia bacterium]|nr:GTP-binding protein [Clostridia bacterium]
MTKIDIFSGFLGAGKTTLIKKLLKEAYAGEKVVLIENEFGEIGIDGGFLKDAGIEITEMNSGCICCSLVGDFAKALSQVFEQYNPDRVIIEPSGVGKLSDVIRAVRGVETETAKLNCYTTVVDAGKCKMYMKNFGEFFNDQIENASSVILSHTDTAKGERVEEAVKLVREHNASAVIVTTPWNSIDGKEILSAMEEGDTLEKELEKLEHEHHHHHCHHHDHDEHDEHCTCGCHDHEHEHEHHHHDHDEHDEHCTCGCHDHEHHHDHDEHDEHCTCGCHDHHHHHADEVFASFGVETSKIFTEDMLKNILEEFDEGSDYGMILRAKGIVAADGGRWLHFDYVPGEADIRYGSASVIGRLCVIGSGINKEKIKELIGV